ncbi:oxidoreductase molybdopterin binding protein [Thalassoporum mexicanum PCC 7367]|nr:protein-methionine-sulfoxide reductase catalytic subunit MsrP [Pseudanabaena sp. PCC 7367]AFY68832.1 oxidoreductase molybdopterin binding protein [Pseudanabaena sp. PCC 7367]
MLIKIKPGWFLPEHEATPESVFSNRRQFIKKLGLASISGAALLSGCGKIQQEQVRQNLEAANLRGLSFTPNPKFTLDRPLTSESVAATYNNFYEFSSGKEVWRNVGSFNPHPWSVEISGMVNNPQTLAIEDLLAKMPLEERLYRHRCVEAWAMAVPWIGFPLQAMITQADPKPAAKYVKFSTFYRPNEAPLQSKGYPWPYTEGLTIEEAANELTFVAVGIYGHELPKQHGAPIRLVLPWKYGFKSIKSIDKIEFTDQKPATFWNTLVPSEYGFEANVNPNIPHPRWSQATERMISTGDRRKTLLYNGYGEYVADLYNI